MKNKSYMELCLKRDGVEALYLRIPTHWDEKEKQWIGNIIMPSSKRAISAKGKNNPELLQSFHQECIDIFEIGGALADELFDMFMPAFYWEDNETIIS
jgi:hypothetical protein